MDEQTIAQRATRPSDQDVAIAEEAIVGALSSGLAVQHRDNLIDHVRTRMRDEPLPALFNQLEGVNVDDCRRCWVAATAMTALANLQWTGQIIPCDMLTIPTLPDLVLQTKTPERSGPLRDMRPEYGFPVATQLRLSPWLTAIAPDTLSALLGPLPGTGDKVRRVLREAVEAYKRGLNVAAAVLLGVASEAAWMELALAIVTLTSDPDLTAILQGQRSRPAALADRCVDLLPRLLRPRPDHEVRRLATEAAHLRDLRDHAVHQPEGRFEDELFTRAAIGVELQNGVNYFRRLYGAIATIRALPAQR